MSVTPASSEVADPIDRRTLRSRRLLKDALGNLLKKRDFDDISIQEIADEANLTRATFYLHYPDKAALLQAVTACRFSELLKKRGIQCPKRAGDIKAIALGVCDYLIKSLGCPSSLRKIPLERSIIPVIERTFREGAARVQLTPSIDPDLFATTMAWAIFGAASHWAQTPNRPPAEEMAETIELLVRPLMESVVTSTRLR